MSRSSRIREHRASCLPLDEFPESMRQRIEEEVRQPYPPSKWRYFGPDDSPYPLASMISRGWFEWQWARGIDPTEEHRERIPEHVGATVIERDWPFCQLCGGRIALGEHHLDHIIPWSHGGKNTVENLRLAHDICNMRRGAPSDGA